MRLLFVIRSLANAGGGAERVLAAVAGGLLDRGYEVSVATFDRPGASTFYDLPPGVERIGLEVGDPRRSASPLEAVRRTVALRRSLRRAVPDVVVGFMHSAYVPLALARLGSGTAMVASDHIGMHHYRTRPAWERGLVAAGQRLADVVTVPSEAARTSYGARRAAGLRVVPNPVPADGLPPDPVRGRTVLAVGRLEEQKDHRTLLEAFARVAADRPGWSLGVVGDGPLRRELESTAVMLGLTGRVTFHGVVQDVGGLMREAAVLAVPSRYESFGMATAEALARGLPAVGFADCPGTDELIVDGVNGLLVRGSDRVAALAEGLARLLDDAALRSRCSAAAPATVARYAPEVVLDAWERIVAEATAGPGGGR